MGPKATDEYNYCPLTSHILHIVSSHFHIYFLVRSHFHLVKKDLAKFSNRLLVFLCMWRLITLVVGTHLSQEHNQSSTLVFLKGSFQIKRIEIFYFSVLFL